MGFLRRLAQRMSASIAGVDRVRLIGTLLIVAVGVGALWWTSGRQGDTAEPQAFAVLTAGPWLADQPTGDWGPVQVPARLVGVLAAPEDLQNAAAKRDLPSGVLVNAADITTAVKDAGTTALLTLPVSIGRWPGEGPQPGDRALLVASGRTCAETTAQLLDVHGDAVVLSADPQLAATLAQHSWEILAAPSDEQSTLEWLCPQAPQPRGSQVAMRFEVNPARWPFPGPQVADEAMFLEAGRGCAEHIVALAGVEGSSVTVVADRELYAALEGPEWLMLPAPQDPATKSQWRCPQDADDLE